MDGHRIDHGPPEFFIKLRKRIKFLHLKHERSDGFCLRISFCLCGAELLKLLLGFFVPLNKAVVPGSVFDLVLYCL